MRTIEADRVILRPFCASDREAFAQYRSDPDVARYQSWEAPYTLEEAAEFIDQMRERQPGIPGQWYQFAIERREKQGIIGDCALHILGDNPRQGEIGFTLARAYQAQGLATEAVTTLLDYAFGDLNLHRVTATCDASNVPSARLLARIGMRREAHFIENVWFKGAWSSEFQFALLQREWRSIRGGAHG